MSADNDNSLYVVLESQGNGLMAMYDPPLFRSEAAELTIRTEPRIIAFSCAWYFCAIAHRAIEENAKQIVMEDETDVTANLRDVLDSVLSIYGGPDIEFVMRFMPDCRKLAFRRKKLWNSRFQAWLDSGGKHFNIMTREEKASNPDV